MNRMHRQGAVREALVYLDSVRGQYPYGIPKQTPGASRSASCYAIHIMAAVTPSGRSMLEAARAQGLKLPESAMLISDIPRDFIHDPEKLRSWAQERAAAHPSKVLVLLGRQLAEALGLGNSTDQQRAKLFGCSVLCSEDLDAITTDTAAKKRFWSVLKKTIPIIEQA